MPQIQRLYLAHKLTEKKSISDPEKLNNIIRTANNPQFKRFIENEGLGFKAIHNFTKDSIQSRQDLYKAICKKIWATDLLMK